MTNSTYRIQCKLCQGVGLNVIYHGESGATLYSRNVQHLQGLRLATKGNILWEHAKEDHNSQMEASDWEFVRTGTFRTVLQRQAAEGTFIAEEVKKVKQAPTNRMVSKEGQEQAITRPKILNSRSDFFQPGNVHQLHLRMLD